MKKKKIAFVIWSLAGIGGSERVVYDLVRNLDRSRYSSMVIAFDDGPFRARYDALGAKTCCIGKSKKIDIEFVKNFRKILADEGVEVVNPHHFSPLLYTFLASGFTGMKLVYTEHSRWQLEQLPLHKKIANRIMLGNIDGVVAISDQIMSYYLDRLRLPRNRVHLIPNGVDIPAFRNSTGNGLRQRLGIGRGDRIIGIVANIRPEKNHKLLVSAFSDVVKIHKNTKLIVAGLDIMNGDLQSFTERLGLSERVLFLGERDDVPDLLSVFDIFCLPSMHEGLPLTVLEAMAAGVPVVGSDVPGINEVVEQGENGLLFPPGDREKLTECLLLLLKDHSLRRRLSSSGKGFVEKKYSLDAAVSRYEELFGAM